MPDPFAIYDRRSTSLPLLIGHVDGYLDEEHERQVTVTRFPVESGAELSDHAVKEPDSLKLTGWTSDLFPTDPADIPETDRPAQAWAEINRIMEARQLLEVVTILGVYSDMVVTRALAPVTTRTGRGLFFTLEFQQVLTAPLRPIEFRILPTATGPAVDRVVVDADDELVGGAPTTYSPTAREVVEDDLLGDIGEIIGSTIQNVIAAVGGGDAGGVFGALGTGGESALGRITGGRSIPDLLGEKIGQLGSQFGGDVEAT